MSDAPIPIAWTPTAKRALTRLPEKAATAAVEFIYGALAENPRRVGKPLRQEFEGLHSADTRRLTVEGWKWRTSCIQRTYNSIWARFAARGSTPRSAHHTRKARRSDSVWTRV